MSKKVIGRGLASILADSEMLNKEDSSSQGTSIFEISLEAIEVNPFQPRTTFDAEALEELAESIRIHGIIQPITVRKLDSQSYQIIAGERRVQAAKKAGLTTIPAYVRTANDQQMLEMALIENIQREQLNPIEIALSYQRLISECQLKQEELGDRVGKKRSTVTNYLRLLKLPPDIQNGLTEGKLDMGHAKALINVEKVETQLAIFKRILEEQLSVRKVEELVRSLNQPKEQVPKNKNNAPDAEILRLQSKLVSHFGTKVQVQRKGEQGEIKIPFLSNDDLNRILELLNLL
jgi:ParB family chromosome partitioning protein